MTGLLSQQGLRDLNIVVSTNLNFPCQNYVFQCSSEGPSMYMLKSVLNCSIFPTLPSEINTFRCLFLLLSLTVGNNKWYCGLDNLDKKKIWRTQRRACTHTKNKQKQKKPLVPCSVLETGVLQVEVGVNYYTFCEHVGHYGYNTQRSF